MDLEIVKGGMGGPQAVLKFQVEGVGSKKLLSIWGEGLDFFRNNPFNVFLFHLPYKRNGKQLNVSYWVTEAP